MSNAKKPPARGNSIGQGVPEGMFTVAQFAARVGVSADTIRRWVEDEYLEPAAIKQQGQLEVKLFSEEQVAGARKLARQRGYIINRDVA